MRPGEQKFVDEWNEHSPFVDAKAIQGRNVNHMLWMIANEDTIGNDEKTVRSKQTRVANPHTQGFNNGIRINPIEDAKKTTPTPPAPAAPAPPTNRELQHLLDLHQHLTISTKLRQGLIQEANHPFGGNYS
mmetsp:Transcript_39583/g.76946  ORF Transcript_39583/g.76946 Transcript_39583/m.76946 type:complete len:131 (-) Transcript_39583:495-887(-)